MWTDPKTAWPAMTNHQEWVNLCLVVGSWPDYPATHRDTHTPTPTVSGVKMGAEKEKKEEGLLGRKGTSGFSQPYCDSEVFEEWEIISNSHTDLSMYTQGSDCLHLTRVVCRNKWLNLVFTLNPTPPPSIFKPVFGTHKMNILSFYQGFNLSLRLGQ